MTDEKQGPGLITKLATIMGELDAIPKLGFNKAQSYKFRRADDVDEAVSKQLAKHHIMLFADTVEETFTALYQTQSGNTMWLAKVIVEYHFVDGDTGETSPRFRVPGTGADTGDKGHAKAMTMSKKYALGTVFLIGGGDDPEADEKVDKAVAAKAAATSGPRVKATSRPGAERGGRPTQASNPQLAEVARLIRELELDGPAMLSIIKAVLKVDVAPGDIKGWLTSLDPASLGTLIAAMSAIEDAESGDDEETDTEVTGDTAPGSYDDGFAIA